MKWASAGQLGGVACTINLRMEGRGSCASSVKTALFQPCWKLGGTRWAVQSLEPTWPSSKRRWAVKAVDSGSIPGEQGQGVGNRRQREGTSGKRDQGSELPRCGGPQGFSVRANCCAEGEAEKSTRGRGTPSRTLCSATVVGEQREEEWKHQSSFCCTLLAARSSVLRGGERARGARQGSGSLSVAAVSAGQSLQYSTGLPSVALVLCPAAGGHSWGRENEQDALSECQHGWLLAALSPEWD